MMQLDQRDDYIEEEKEDDMEFDDDANNHDQRVNHQLFNIIGNLKSRITNIASNAETPDILNNINMASLNNINVPSLNDIKASTTSAIPKIQQVSLSRLQPASLSKFQFSFFNRRHIEPPEGSQSEMSSIGDIDEDNEAANIRRRTTLAHGQNKNNLTIVS